MPDLRSTIYSHNQHVLNKSTSTLPSKKLLLKKNRMDPLDGYCLSKSIVHKAEVCSVDDGSVKEYIGMTSNKFKDRYRTTRSPSITL